MDATLTVTESVSNSPVSVLELSIKPSGRKGVIERVNLDKIHRAIGAGAVDRDWYASCEKNFRTIFGDDKLQLVCRLFAATSINSSLLSNVKLFRKALQEMESGKPFSNYLPNIKLQLERLRRGEGLSGRKIESFARAMSGDKNAVVVDIWLLRAFNLDRQYVRAESSLIRSGGASKLEYDFIEKWVRDEARVMLVEPRQLSAMIWSGMRTLTNGRVVSRYEELLNLHFSTLFGGYKKVA